jgi:hypothetical protein
MKNFDPERAVMLDDIDENGEFDDFLAQVEKKAKAFRFQIVGNAFRQLATTAKDTQEQLLKIAEEKLSKVAEADGAFAKKAEEFVMQFSEEAGKDRATMVDGLTKRALASHARFEAQLGKLLDAQGKLDESLRGVEARLKEAGGNPRVISAAVEEVSNALIGELKTMETQRKKDHADLTSGLDALEADVKSEEPKPERKPVKWKFTFGRDQFGRIDGEVIATELK